LLTKANIKDAAIQAPPQTRKAQGERKILILVQVNELIFAW